MMIGKCKSRSGGEKQGRTSKHTCIVMDGISSLRWREPRKLSFLDGPWLATLYGREPLRL